MEGAVYVYLKATLSVFLQLIHQSQQVLRQDQHQIHCKELLAVRAERRPFLQTGQLEALGPSWHQEAVEVLPRDYDNHR